MNPITALFDSIEKLITEHGSATILREHLSLLKSQMSILTKENTELKAKNQILEAKNQDLKQENIDLNQKIEEFSHKSPPGTIAIVNLHDSKLDKI